MEISWKWVCAALVVITVLMIEAFSEVLDIFYGLNLVLQAITNMFTPLMPTTGPFAQAANNAISFVNLVSVIFCLSSLILLVVSVCKLYKLIFDKY